MSSFGNTSCLGSALILAGTAIGAGMLALPLVSVEIGFMPMLFIFFVIAIFMAYSALLMFEANLIVGKGCSLYVMASKALGRPGQVVATLVPLGLFYSLMAAYLSGGGVLIKELGKKLFGMDIPVTLGSVLFSLITCGVVFYSTKAVDYINRSLFFIMLVVFSISVLYLVPGIEYQYLSSYGFSVGGICAVLPIVFTSFGYHGSIPSVILYKRDNTSVLPKAFILGTVLSLVFYIIWLLVSIGTLPREVLEHISQSEGAVGELVAQLSQVVVSLEALDSFLHVFSHLALITSVLGVSLGLFDYLASLFQRKDTFTGRSQTAFLTFLPSLLFAILYPNSFISALGYAAIALSLLAVLLPVAMVWTLREKGLKGDYRVPGGNCMLALCGIFGIVIIVSQVIVITGFE